MKTVVLYNGRTYKRLKDGMHGRAFPSNIAGKLCRQPGCLPYIYFGRKVFTLGTKNGRIEVTNSRRLLYVV
ncbi:hypothetical protein [Paenibacillus larvae]|uniref:Uncharacterized protein n=1 Tax=Paenibacillus larvae subsp. larvae TaxID=147375 RepID=A0A6C0QZB5_9BACL|nr:hypothetical protein [Paenibacillus larvae]QHZ54065.1 hypothetical protein ERICV_05081 [Paenibacillus larvae subsp. larvae]